MDNCCSVKQIAKAVILSAMDDEWEEYLIEHEYPTTLKSLDTFITTVYNSATVFDVKFQRISNKYKERFSKEEYENFLAPRCEILAENSDYFGLIISCTFVSEMVRNFRVNFHCLHFDSVAYKCLSKFLERRFKSLEQETYWNGLLDYCREINKRIAFHRHHKIPLPTVSSWSSSTGNYVKFSDESDEHAFVRTSYFNIITPPQYKSKILNLIKQCETGFECASLCRSGNEIINTQIEKEIPSSSAAVSEETDKNFKSNNNTEKCTKCKNQSFKYHCQKWRRAFKKRYKNWNMVSDIFDRKQSDESTSS